VNGNIRTGTSVNPTDFFGAVLPGGSQVFAGFREANKVIKIEMLMLLMQM
jgi:iron complex outermembrane receptor protein